MTIWQVTQARFTDGLNMFSGMLKSSLGDPDAWEASIRRFEAQDRLTPVRKGAIVFTGSSSFTFWSTLEEDMAPLPVINRGFGGSRINDVVHYAGRTVLAYRPRAVVLFVGTNDIAWPRPATAQQVFDGYREFVQKVHAALPETCIYYVSITPSPARWRFWSIVQEANRLIRTTAETDPRLHFIDLTDAILGADGKLDRSLYRADGLHPNKNGYIKWAAIIKPVLQADLSRD